MHDEPATWIYDCGLFYVQCTYQDTATNITKDQFAQNFKIGSDIYQHAHIAS